jgi:predicted neutral ceramidase superfamily lipid hydrolase
MIDPAVFMVGLFVGASGMILIGFVDGLFGEYALKSALLVSVIALLAFVAVSGVEGAAESYRPIEYWIGFILGVFVGGRSAIDLNESLRRDGTPLAVATAHRLLYD